MTIGTAIKTNTTQVIAQEQVVAPGESAWDDFFSSTQSATDDFMAECGSSRDVFEALAGIELPADFPDEIPQHQTRP